MVIGAYLKGCNILMLVLKSSTRSDYFKEVVAPLCKVVKHGDIIFKNYKQSMGRDQVLVQFFQPDHKEYLYELYKANGKNF